MLMNPKEEIQIFRKQAWNKFWLGLIGSVALVGIFVGPAFGGVMPGNPFMFIPVAIPFVYLCIGFIELLSGRPFQQLADAWMELRGWQRGVIGTIIVFVAGFIMILVVTIVIMAIT
jgi:hypothetical protein